MINETLKFTNCPPSKKKKKRLSHALSKKRGIIHLPSVNLYLPAQAMDLMNPQFGNILFCIINHQNAITSLF